MTTERLAIIATKGTLDMAYPPLILASVASSLGVESAVFFTFYGLNIVHKERVKELKVSPVGNPAMPLVFPDSVKETPALGRLADLTEKLLPGLPQVLGVLPGMTDFVTAMLKKRMKEKGIASIEELLQLCKEAEVKLVPCQMTMELFGYKKEDLIEGTEEPAGAAEFFNYVLGADKPLIIFV